MSASSQDVLQFWRNIEIFHLPDLDKDALPLSKLEVMPWENPEPLKNEKKIRRFIFYIGRVDKREVVDCLEQLSKEKAGADRVEPVTGETCLAAITLDEFGRPYPNSYVQASYVHGIHCLVNNRPLSGINELLADVQREFEKRYHIEVKTPAPGEEGAFIRRGDVVTRELLEAEMTLLEAATDSAFKFEREVYWSAIESTADSDVELPILNSFYLDDLNYLINHPGNFGKSLKAYLAPEIDEKHRKDVNTDREALLRCLHPSMLSPGRWPSAIDYGLYTAQQAAVNTMLSALKEEGGIRGVNGPPGTGKTTLLLDIIADVIVSKALILVEMEATAIFSGKVHPVEAERFIHYYYDFGRADLFEDQGIVVSSNNNRAVENISKELPAEEKIDRKAFPQAGYFMDCASRLLEDKKSWGILSAALGNAKNKWTFKKNFWDSDELRKGFKDHLQAASKGNDKNKTGHYIALFEKTKAELKQLLKSFDQFRKDAGIYHDMTFPARPLKKAISEKRKSAQAAFLQEQYGIAPENLVDIDFVKKDKTAFHLSTPYASPNINQLRSTILIKSLELHEYAILANAGKFRSVLQLFMEVLVGKMKVTDEVANILWQTFFFCVPVVSTTLASASRLFKHMGCGRIGWLLLDEAGQATPQSAAGIIWRSKRCIIVGDPQQIKPVVTHPEQLIKHLRKEAGVDQLVWSPLVSSVQSLADRISEKGTFLGEGDAQVWSGFPLRAHRRCDNPMFDISNKIAYEKQMVKATGDTDFNSAIGKSCWFHVAGVVVLEKHVIQEEMKLLKFLVYDLIRSGYDNKVFIISPFTSVKLYCEKMFEGLKKFSGKQKKMIECGTVHTFQGREAEIVFFVLGSDPNIPGARKWVTESPNIINVALTRARHRFYMIGNKKLWGKLPFINQFKEQLPVINMKMEEIPD